MCVLLAYLLQGASGKPSACQSCPQLKDVNASIFVEVELIKQLSPAFLPVLVRTGGFAVLAARPREPSPLGSHNWCQSERADGIQGHQFNHHSLTKEQCLTCSCKANSRTFLKRKPHKAVIVDLIQTLCDLCVIIPLFPSLGVGDPTTGHRSH